MPRRIGLNRRSDLQRSPRFKAAVALAAIKRDRTTAELATVYRIDESVIDLWKKQALAALPAVFAAAGQSDRSATTI